MYDEAPDLADFMEPGQQIPARFRLRTGVAAALHQSACDNAARRAREEGEE